jgi:hypothetical protein
MAQFHISSYLCNKKGGMQNLHTALFDFTEGFLEAASALALAFS